jgi:hypothetical protein
MLVFDPGGRRSRSNVRILIGKQRSGPARVADCLNSRKPVRKKERPPCGGPTQMFRGEGDQIANARLFVFRRAAA